MNNMTPEQALQSLNTVFSAAQLSPLNFQQHELVRKCAEAVAEQLKPKEEPKGD
jgi:hypothetical protein